MTTLQSKAQLVIQEYLMNEFPSAFPTSTHANFATIDMILNHGMDSLVDLYGFMKFAEQNELDAHAVKSTFAHDIGGRNDELMLPRSHGYKQYAK
jgi:hypothetical protein